LNSEINGGKTVAESNNKFSIKGMLDYLVQGYSGKREAIFGDMIGDFEEEEYEVEDNLALAPAYNNTYQQAFQPKADRTNDLKVVSHPNYRGFEVMVIEPRSFEDAAQISVHLKDRKTVVLNLHLLDKEQSQRTIDFICGAAHALNGKPQKVGELVFVFTPSNVTLSVDVKANQDKFNDSLWRAPLGL
jgi:cell division inhibitor SepF